MHCPSIYIPSKIQTSLYDTQPVGILGGKNDLKATKSEYCTGPRDVLCHAPQLATCVLLAKFPMFL